MLYLTFCLNQILIYHHLVKNLQIKEDKNISIDSGTEEEITLEEHEDIDNIDNSNSIIDEEISEALEASHQTGESSRKRPANTSRAGQKKRKKPKDKYAGIIWQKSTNWWDEKEVIHWSSRYFCCSYDRELD